MLIKPTYLSFAFLLGLSTDHLGDWVNNVPFWLFLLPPAFPLPHKESLGHVWVMPQVCFWKNPNVSHEARTAALGSNGVESLQKGAEQFPQGTCCLSLSLTMMNSVSLRKGYAAGTNKMHYPKPSQSSWEAGKGQV